MYRVKKEFAGLKKGVSINPKSGDIRELLERDLIEEGEATKEQPIDLPEEMVLDHDPEKEERKESLEKKPAKQKTTKQEPIREDNPDMDIKVEHA